MCGIIGFASRSPIQDRNSLIVGREAMKHRGPDDAGVWWSENGQVGFGHRRLAIIDLSHAGHQPMQDSTGSFTIVFNGEIYNYRDLQKELSGKGHVFRSQSDTEVILAAYREWGTKCLCHLNGMFAFAIYDTAEQRIFLARDRAGEKPLFYYLSDGCLRFASELKGLLADPAVSRRLDAEAMDCLLAIGFVPGERCIIQGIRKLPPAHAMIFDVNKNIKNIWRYWQLPVPPKESDQDEFGLEDELEKLLEDSVRRQMVADVPVGVLLSGGVDSSLITAMAVRASNRVKTFTVGFDGFGKYDETKHARLIARHFGTTHIELNAGRVTPELLALLALQYDEPMIDSSMIPTYLVSQMVRQHCTVALGGDGADELFGGYQHYDRLLWRKQKIDWLPLEFRKLIASCAGELLPQGFRGRNWLKSLSCDLATSLPPIATFFDDSARKKLVNNKNWKLVANDIRKSRVPVVENLLQRATRMDFENYLPEDILVKVDRASMINSLELRAPMLDLRVIELAFGRVPSHMKTTLIQRKIILKRIAARLLPPEFDRQRKQGFSVPLRNWLKEKIWHDYFHDILLNSNCIFDKKSVKNLFNGQAQGRNNHEGMFGLVLFELWRQKYKISMQ